jgi:hypothetical protein
MMTGREEREREKRRCLGRDEERRESCFNWRQGLLVAISWV